MNSEQSDKKEHRGDNDFHFVCVTYHAGLLGGLQDNNKAHKHKYHSFNVRIPLKLITFRK